MVWSNEYEGEREVGQDKKPAPPCEYRGPIVERPTVMKDRDKALVGHNDLTNKIARGVE